MGVGVVVISKDFACCCYTRTSWVLTQLVVEKLSWFSGPLQEGGKEGV